LASLSFLRFMLVRRLGTLAPSILSRRRRLWVEMRWWLGFKKVFKRDDMGGELDFGESCYVALN